MGHFHIGAHPRPRGGDPVVGGTTVTHTRGSLGTIRRSDITQGCQTALARTMMRTIVGAHPHGRHLPIGSTTITDMKTVGVGTAPATLLGLVTQAGMVTIGWDALPLIVAEVKPEAGGAHFTPDSRAEKPQEVLRSIELLPCAYAFAFTTGIMQVCCVLAHCFYRTVDRVMMFQGFQRE